MDRTACVDLPAFPLQLLLGILVLLVPGALMSRIWMTRTDEDGVDWPRFMLIALSYGMGVVPSLAFFFHLATTVPVSWTTMTAVSLANSVAAAICLVRWDRGCPWWARLMPTAGLGRTKGSRVGVLA